jgi:type 1 glutamine amidotransferase
VADVLLISGGGAYVDEWHDFPTTSARLAAIVEGLGHSLRLTEDVEAALTSPGAAQLLVLNLGGPAARRPPEAVAAARAGLDSYLATGGALLSMHSSVIALSAVPEWQGILGGTWIHGRSMHPPQSEARVERAAGVEHPIVDGLDDFTAFDERYSHLEVDPGNTVLFDHEHDRRRHPLVWARTSGPGRIVYDALGHDGRSFDSPGHRELVRRSVGWLLGEQ